LTPDQSRDPLPIDTRLPAILDAIRQHRALVLTAEPGAGKTTRVPPALVEDGPVILLQPRRAAARAIARRIAAERGWTIGAEIGWQIRFERRFGPRTRLLVATEGVLTARLERDPLLSDFRSIVIDEFHERSIHADLALALARQAWRARDDLRIVVMSATLDVAPVSAFLGGCPVIEVPGRTYPLEIAYAPGVSMDEAIAGVLGRTSGSVLGFLPGAGEIRRAMPAVAARAGSGVEVLQLHGSLDADEQDRALRPPADGRRRVILATNIAETSVTVPGVTAVVDTGLQKIARYDAPRGIDSLETERVTADAADQRAGRAGREQPGVAIRLWDRLHRLRPHREPEILRIDLAPVVLDVLAWGGDPRTLEWFEAPPAHALDVAAALLERLGAVRDGRLTPLGRQIQRFPLSPRLARMLVAAGGARPMARACALLSERHFLPPRQATTSSDLLSALDDWSAVPPHVASVAREIEQIAGHVLGGVPPTSMDETSFRRAVLAGYPDRVALRREAGSPRVRLASGAGASIAPESGVRDGQFLVALDVQASTRPNEPDARIRLASRVEPEWLEPNASSVEHRLDEARGVATAVRVDRYDALVLAERPVPVNPEQAASIVADAWLARGPSEEDQQLLNRLRFAGQHADVGPLVRAAAAGARSLKDVHLERAVSPSDRHALERDAPETLQVPSGRSVRLEYADDGSVGASVKLQELFGLAETPRIGVRKAPVVFSLLAPNGRPVQVTRDLRSFWERTYPEIRKELRGRYPRHPWPEDPWTAPPTAKTKKRTGG
jgi:ATP-dependent helicase HrpB